MLPSINEIKSLREFTPTDPLRLFISSCLRGEKCGVDGSSYGEFPWIQKLISLPNVKPAFFCPEQFSFGTPRAMPDIHGGNGFDVLDGEAKVLTDKGEDWTSGMLRAAEKMLDLAKIQDTEIAVLMDMSAACGVQVISDGCRLIEGRKYQKGPGVCAALFIRNGIKVISQRDFKILEVLSNKLDKSHRIDESKRDHHETDWYRDYFKGP
jgi:uncharacterized protein YbbK (DUF523 family)